MSKFVKKLEMEQLERDFGDITDMVVVNVIGLNASESHSLRMDLRKKGISLRVVRNSLAQRVLGEKGLRGLDGILSGASAIAWGGAGIVELAKEITDWAKKVQKLQIKGGCIAGQALDPQGVEQVSKMPSREELLGRIANLIASPGGNLIRLMNSPGGALASQIKQISEKKEVDAAPAAAAG